MSPGFSGGFTTSAMAKGTLIVATGTFCDATGNDPA